jgi:hypothetical protein
MKTKAQRGEENERDNPRRWAIQPECHQEGHRYPAASPGLWQSLVEFDG